MIVLTVDTGGNGIRTCEVEIDGQKCRALPETLSESGPARSLEEWDAHLSRQIHAGLDGISYAAAGVIEQNNKMLDWPNGHWLDGTELGTWTKDRYGLLTYVFNDMEAAATGMAELTGEANFLGVTFSSGWGARVFLNGRMVDSAAELGHLTVDYTPNALPCPCGKVGHYEGIFAGVNMRREIHKLASRANMPVPAGMEPGQYLDQMYAKNVIWAVAIYDWWSRGVGLWLAAIASSFPIDAVVYKGSQGKYMIPHCRPKILEYATGGIIGGLEPRIERLRIMETPGNILNEESFVGAGICWNQTTW